MSKNLSYLKSNYPNSNQPTINIYEREKSPSLSPHRPSNHRRTLNQSNLKNQDLPSTEAKRNRQFNDQYVEAPTRTLYQQKTNKKTNYPRQQPLQSSVINNPQTTSYQINSTSTNYAKTGYQGSVNKVQLLKQQNIYLSDQNIHLNELLAEKGKIILNLQKKLEYQMQQQVMTLQQIQREKNKFLQDFHARDDEKRIEIQKLLIQLRNANQQIKLIIVEKEEIVRKNAVQLELAKSTLAEQHRASLDSVVAKKDTEIKNKDTHINELTLIMQQLKGQLRTSEQTRKANEQHLSGQLQKILQQLQLVNHQKKIQLSEQKIAFQNIILTLNKEKQQEIANTSFKYEVQLKKYKNLLKEQILANSTLQNRVQSTKLQHSGDIQKRINDETQLKHQLYQLENFYQQKHREEIQKEKQLSTQQNKIVQKANKLKDQEYQEDLNKLITINKQAKTEIDRLYEEIERLRQQNKEEVQRLQTVNSELKARISELSQSSQDQTETLKIKLGQLRHTDISSLKQYYENQLGLKTQEIMDLQKIVKENRDKIHKELQTKVIQRKHHEKLVDDLRIKIGQLELRIAMMAEQHKERIHSMGSQIQMTSLTLIRESAQKERHTQQAEIEKKNLQAIINKKDQEIEQLNSKLFLIKKSHSEEIQENQQTISILHDKNQQLNDQIKRQRQFYQKQIQKKEQLKKQIKEFYEAQILKEKETYSKEFSEVTQKLMKEKNELNIQIEHLLAVEKQLRDELSLHAEHHEQRTLQKDVSYNEEKARLQYSKQSMEINMKNYYEKKMADIQEELKITKNQLAEKSQDVRTLNEKNYKLQKKIEKIMENQEKLRGLEEKVMALGQQNNLVKNFAELSGTKTRKRQV